MELLLIIAIPFLLSLILATPVKDYLPKMLVPWGSGLIMAVLFIRVVAYLPTITSNGAISTYIPWIEELGISLSIYLDGLALLFAMVITGIGSLICIYTGYYFEDQEEQNRFLMFLLAFTGAMLGVVMFGNLIVLFIAWELTSITSFMLIGFKGKKSTEARFGATQALFVTSLGGLGLLVGAVILGFVAGQIIDPVSAKPVFEFSEILSLHEIANSDIYLVFTVLIMLGAFTKSAQMPFHFWLPGAMSAPTPASAFLHSATMVKAGIYLLARMYPMLSENPFWTDVLLLVGLTTMFLGAFFSLRQRDLKGMLAYLTVSTLGALVALIGLPEGHGFKALAIGILAHALYKAALFLSTGTIDHVYHTRIIDKLGGIWRDMPVVSGTVIISALSMAGVPILFGFVAKEVLLDAMIEDLNSFWLLLMLFFGAVFTVCAALIIIWDVLFRKKDQKISIYHPMPGITHFSAAMMALGSLILGILIEPIIKPIIKPMVPYAFSVHLLPDDPLSNHAFMMSSIAIFLGILLFLTRRYWLRFETIQVPTATEVYQLVLSGLDKAGDIALKLQAGNVRYYLVIIIAVTCIVLLTSPILSNLNNEIIRAINELQITPTFVIEIGLLFTAVISAGVMIFVRRHLTAVLLLGVFGFTVGAIFVINQAPDVAMVQIIIETLSTVLIIILLSRIDPLRREEMITRSFISRTRYGVTRDALLAAAAGTIIFLFSVSALFNRPARDSISLYYLENAYRHFGTTDVVGAIVSDYRGFDTLIEICVFATAALGTLMLLSRGRKGEYNILIPSKSKTQGDFDTKTLKRIKSLNPFITPLTQGAAWVVLPIGIMMGISHILNGGNGPGDGFTAGVVIGVTTSIWYIVYGYEEAKTILSGWQPQNIIRFGLVMVLINALLPILLGENFMAYVAYDSLLGIDTILKSLGLKLTSTLIYEIGIALTVMGGIGIIIESIAHPDEVKSLESDKSATQEMERLDLEELSS